MQNVVKTTKPTVALSKTQKDPDLSNSKRQILYFTLSNKTVTNMRVRLVAQREAGGLQNDPATFSESGCTWQWAETVVTTVSWWILVFWLVSLPSPDLPAPPSDSSGLSSYLSVLLSTLLEWIVQGGPFVMMEKAQMSTFLESYYEWSSYNHVT